MQESPEPMSERGGAGLLVALLVAGSIMCVGSIGAAGYFLWKAAQNTANRERDAEIEKQYTPDKRE